jgi:large subunit ribosomal protein L4
MSKTVKTTKKTKTATVAAPTISGARILTAQEVGVSADANVVDAHGFAVYVRALLQNWRQGTVGVKGRSEVAYANRKPWKQKGTGRARAGSARSPLWRGGGICHGPQPRTRTLCLPQGMKKNVLHSLCLDYITRGKVICLDEALSTDKPHTSQAARLLKNAGLTGKKVNVFLPFDDKIAQSSFVNIKNVRVLFFNQPNAFELASAHWWVVQGKDVSAFKEMVSKWL